MKLEVVLNGGLKSCCSTYPPDFVLHTVNSWVAGKCDVTVIDAKEGNWHADDPADAAIRYFGDSAFPFTYIDGMLMVVGVLPDREQIAAMLSDKERRGITIDEVIAAAKKYGRYNTRQNGQSGH